MGAHARRAGRTVAATILGAAVLTGCSNGGPSTDVSVVALDDSSSRIVRTDDGVALRVDATVVNASDAVLDDVVVTVVLDDALDPYLAAGAVPLSGLSADHVYPRDTARADVPSGGALGIHLTDTRHLADTGTDLSAVLDLARHVTLEVTWDGGNQDLAYTTAVLDPDGLIDP